MKIKNLTVKNVRSFKDEVRIIFDDKLNIFVGPNAGGKSNLLDIITVVLRHFFLHSWSVETGKDAAGMFKKIRSLKPFLPLSDYLDKFTGDNSDSKIKIELQVGAQDVENMQQLKVNIDKFQKVLSDYREKPYIEFLDSMDYGSKLKPDQILKYSITNYKFNEVFFTGNETSHFLHYLNFFNLFVMLARERMDIKLNPICLYFPPYRWVDQQHLQVDLYAQNFDNLLVNYIQSTSKSYPSSLLTLATHHFARKRRYCELQAETDGYDVIFRGDKEVQLVTKYLNQLGYDWELKALIPEKNIYEMTFKSKGNRFPLSKASSGEKEIINYLLGIFAFNINNGVVIIEEPEIHLHPKWQSVLMNLFVDLADLTNNQFIISTHSSVFINEKTIPNVSRVYKKDNKSEIISITKENLPTDRDLLHIVNSHNNEKLFFADKVVLVEGIKDRLIVEKMIDAFSPHAGSSEITEVLEVHGKNFLLTYRKFLESIKVENFIITDLDYVVEIGELEIKELFVVDQQRIEKDVIKNKRSEDCRLLFRKLDEAINNGNLESLKDVWMYIKNRIRRLKSNLGDTELKLLNEFIESKKKAQIYILKEGEIEDYLPIECKSLDRVIELLKDGNFYKWLINTRNDKCRSELDGIIFNILKIDCMQRDNILSEIEHKYMHS